MAQLEIMFDDLTEEAQKEVLEFFGMVDMREGNFDVVPLCVVEYYPEDEMEDA